MSLSKRKSFYLSALILIFASTPSPSSAAECKTASGSKCTVSCSSGTASAVCSSSSKNCSTSCSDSSGNLNNDLVRSLMIATEGKLGDHDARRAINYQLNLDSLRNKGGTQTLQIGDSAITIDVDRQR